MMNHFAPAATRRPAGPTPTAVCCPMIVHPPYLPFPTQGPILPTTTIPLSAPASALAAATAAQRCLLAGVMANQLQQLQPQQPQTLPPTQQQQQHQPQHTSQSAATASPTNNDQSQPASQGQRALTNISVNQAAPPQQQQQHLSSARSEPSSYNNATSHNIPLHQFFSTPYQQPVPQQHPPRLINQSAPAPPVPNQQQQPPPPPPPPPPPQQQHQQNQQQQHHQQPQLQQPQQHHHQSQAPFPAVPPFPYIPPHVTETFHALISNPNLIQLLASMMGASSHLQHHHPSHYHHPHHHHHMHGAHHHNHNHGNTGQSNGQDDTMLTISESKPRGLSRPEIELLTSYVQVNEKDNRTCVICLSKFELKSKIRPLPCNHAFHAKCVDKWLRANRTCPICRRDALKTLGGKIKRI